MALKTSNLSTVTKNLPFNLSYRNAILWVLYTEMKERLRQPTSARRRKGERLLCSLWRSTRALLVQVQPTKLIIYLWKDIPHYQGIGPKALLKSQVAQPASRQPISVAV